MSQDGSLSLNHRLPAAFLPPRPAAHLLPPSPNCPLPPSSHGSSFLFLLHLSSEAPLHLRNLRERRERERPPFESCQHRQFATCLRSCLPLLSLLSVREESASTTAESAAILAGLSAIGRDLDDRWRPGINQRDEVERDKLKRGHCNRQSSMNIFFFSNHSLEQSWSGKFFYISLNEILFMFLFVDWLFSSLSIYHKVMTLFGNILKLKSFFFLIIFLYLFYLNKYLYF